VFLGAGPRSYSDNLFGVFIQYVPGMRDKADNRAKNRQRRLYPRHACFVTVHAHLSLREFDHAQSISDLTLCVRLALAVNKVITG